MNTMTNNLATDEKPTRPNGQSVVLLSAVGGISLGGRMEDELIDSVVSMAVILIGIIVFFILWTGRAEAVEVDMDIIKRIESSGNHLAHNMRNGEDARGWFQIRKPVLVEFNAMNKTVYTQQDLFIPIVNEKIATWYMTKRIPSMLKHYGIKDTVENRIIAYNAGIGTLRKGVINKTTRNYVNRYNRIKRGK